MNKVKEIDSAGQFICRCGNKLVEVNFEYKNSNQLGILTLKCPLCCNAKSFIYHKDEKELEGKK